MSPAILTLETEDVRHQLPCPADACFAVGSAEDSDIALDGIDILKHHCTVRRVGERRFQIAAASPEARCTVNGVTATDFEVEVPFRFAFGGDAIDFDLVVESQGVGSRRRDYLLGPISLRQRSTLSMLPPSVVRPPDECLRMISGQNPSPSATAATKPERRVRTSAWRWVALLTLLAAVMLTSDGGLMWMLRVLARKTDAGAVATPKPESVVVLEKPALSEPPKAAPRAPAPVVDVKTKAARDASAHVAAFLKSWSDESAAAVLGYVRASPTQYFDVAAPATEAVLRVEEEWRARWPQRVVTLTDEPVTTVSSETSVEVLQRFVFELRGMNRDASGTGELRCTVERDASNAWRIVKAADRIELRQALPDRSAFSEAKSLRGLTPVLSAEETKKVAIDQLNALIEAGNHKLALQRIRRDVGEFPEETFWRFSAERVCDELARVLFTESQLPDPTCVEDVVELSGSGVVPAMLLHGHFMRAGYGMPRNEAEGEMLYRRAFDKSKSREARFYFAEALFIAGETEKASAVALATMVSSKHPLEAYLAAHLLWKKAELDPSLWQQVYETVANVAETHPPARNLAGLVLLKHGQTRKEREAGFTLIQQAAEAGVVEAMKNLSMCYEVGDGCEPNAAESERWKTKAKTTALPKRRHFSEWRVE